MKVDTEKTLQGLTGALFVATSRMLRIKPCREKLPCWRGFKRIKPIKKITFSAIIMPFWNQATGPERDDVLTLFAKTRYWRLRGFGSWETFCQNFDSDSGKMMDVLQDDFADWWEEMRPQTTIVGSVTRALLARPEMAISEAKYCFLPLQRALRDQINIKLLRFLHCGCTRVQIINRRYGQSQSKGLAIQFTLGHRVAIV